MKRYLDIAVVCLVVLVCGNTPSLQALTLDDFTSYGGAIRTGDTIYTGGSIAPFTGPVSGIFASNITIPDNLNGVSFNFSATNYWVNWPYLTFKVFEGAPFNTGWNDEGAVFWAYVPGIDYLGDDNIGPPVSVSYSCYVDLTRYQGEAVSLGWTYTQDDSMSVACISNIVFDQVPEPSTIILLGGGLGCLAWFGRKCRKV